MAAAGTATTNATTNDDSKMGTFIYGFDDEEQPPVSVQIATRLLEEFVALAAFDNLDDSKEYPCSLRYDGTGAPVRFTEAELELFFHVFDDIHDCTNMPRDLVIAAFNSFDLKNDGYDIVLKFLILCEFLNNELFRGYL